MNPFATDIQQVITILEDCKDKLAKVTNQEISLLITRLVNEQTKNINALKLQIGQEPTVASYVPNVAKPLTRLFGKDITPGAKKKVVKDVNIPGAQTADQVAQQELRMKVNELYPRFLGMDSDKILDSISDIEIRGIAHRAGLPVTETNPERLTTDFIEKIKTAIQEQNSALKAGNTAPESEPAATIEPSTATGTIETITPPDQATKKTTKTNAKA